MIRRPPRSTRVRSSAASDVYKRQIPHGPQADQFKYYAKWGMTPAQALQTAYLPAARMLNYDWADHIATIEKGRYAKTEARIVLFTALMKDGAYDESLKVLKGLMSDYPENYALYPWATEWHIDQGKKAEGVEYFEKLHAEKLRTSPKLAQRALYEKAILQKAIGKPADARATLSRIRMITTPDAALARNIAAFEKKL